MTIENLEIEIEASSGKATSNLEKLESVLRKVDALGKSKGFDKLYRRLKRIADLDFSHAASGFDALMHKVGAVYRPVQGFNNLANAAENAQAKITDAASAIKRFNKTSDLDSRMKRKPFDASMDTATPEPIDTDELFRDFGNAVPLLAGEVKASGLYDELKKLSAAAGDADKKMSYLGKTMYRFVVYKALNTVIRGIGSGFQNIALYSKEANETLTKYKSITTQIGNTLAATLIPVMNAMYPIIRGLSDLAIDAANSVNMLFSAFGGTYRRAKKYTEDYAKSIGKVKSSVGMDQIHTLGNNAQKYSDMFEDVEINGLDIAGAAAKITALAAAVTVLQQAFTGKSWIGNTVTGFGNLKKNIQAALATTINFRTECPKLSKVLGAAGVAGGTALAATGAYNLTKALGTGNNDGLAGSIASLVTGGVLAVAGGAMIGGPVGALVGGLIALTGAWVGATKAAAEMRYELLKTDYYDVQGASISDVKNALDAYFTSLDFDKQSEWIQKIKDAQDAYNDAKNSYSEMWTVISQKQDIDTSDIDNLAESFNGLAEAAKSLNSVRIDSLMSSISSSIKMNITGELNDRLGELLDKIAVAKSMLNTKISGLQQEYQGVIDNIVANGGTVTADDNIKLSHLRESIEKYALSDDTGAAKWKLALDDAKAVNAGSSKDEILSNVNDLLADRDTYISDLTAKYESDRVTLQQLIDKDTELGGILGIKDNADRYRAAMSSAYYRKIEDVRSQYEDVIWSIINTYESRALDYDYYHDWFRVALESLHAGPDPFDEFFANQKLSEEQKDLLESLYALLGAAPRYATGGFPEDGLFVANHSELVGQFSNGKTAVANNEQIIEGIKRGVMEANMESGSGGDWTIQIVDTDGRVKAETIISATERRNRRDGKTVIALGV